RRSSDLIAMDHSLAMSLCETCADLQRNDSSFLFRQRALAIDALGKGLTLDELHGEEVYGAIGGLCGVQLVELTNVGVADFERGARFGGQARLKFAERALHGDA